MFALFRGVRYWGQMP